MELLSLSLCYKLRLMKMKKGGNFDFLIACGLFFFKWVKDQNDVVLVLRGLVVAFFCCVHIRTQKLLIEIKATLFSLEDVSVPYPNGCTWVFKMKGDANQSDSFLLQVIEDRFYYFRAGICVSIGISGSSKHLRVIIP